MKNLSKQFNTCAIFLLSFLFISVLPAIASHQAGASVSWTRGSTDSSGNVTVNFQAQFAYEGSGGNNGEFFFFGDGNSVDLSSLPSTIVFTGNRPNGQAYFVRQHLLSHTYSSGAVSAYGGAFFAGFSTGCRVNDIENYAPNSNFCDIFVKAVVDLNDSANLGSASSLPPLAVPAKGGSTFEFTLPVTSTDSDSVKCKLNNAEPGVRLVAPSLNGATFSVSEDCKISWDLSGASFVDYGKVFAVQIAFEDSNHPTSYYPGLEQGNQGSSSSSSEPDFIPPAGSSVSGFSSSVVDFLVEIVDPAAAIGVSCSSNAPLAETVLPNTSVNYSYNCVAVVPPIETPAAVEGGDVGDELELRMYTQGQPATSVFIPVSGTSGPVPFNASFTWTASTNDRGQTFPLFALFSLHDPSIQNEGDDSEGASVTFSPRSYAALFPTVLKVPLNAPPTCTIGGAVETFCSGSSNAATASISASASDPDGTPLTLNWTAICPQALAGKSSFSGANSSTLGMSFDVSSLTAVQQCSLIFVASDNENPQSSCTSSVTVKPCNTDCTGAANGTAKVDRCGVCGGDGQSCLDCKTVTTTPSLIALDGNANVAQQLVFRSATLLRKDKRVERKKRFEVAAKLVNDAKAADSAVWTRIWTVPQSVTTCGNTNFCSQASFVSNLSVIDSQLKVFADQLEIAKKTAKSKSLVKKINALITRLSQVNSESVSLLGKLPTAASSCS